MYKKQLGGLSRKEIELITETHKARIRVIKV
jgi:hypothetical protein